MYANSHQSWKTQHAHLLSEYGRPLATSASTVTQERVNSEARLPPPRLSHSWKLSDPLAARLLSLPRERLGRSGRDTTTPCATWGTKSPDNITWLRRAPTNARVNRQPLGSTTLWRSSTKHFLGPCETPPPYQYTYLDPFWLLQ